MDAGGSCRLFREMILVGDDERGFYGPSGPELPDEVADECLCKMGLFEECHGKVNKWPILFMWTLSFGDKQIAEEFEGWKNK